MLASIPHAPLLQHNQNQIIGPHSKAAKKEAHTHTHYPHLFNGGPRIAILKHKCNQFYRNCNNNIHTKFIHNTTLIVSYLLCTPKINISLSIYTSRHTKRMIGDSSLSACVSLEVAHTHTHGIETTTDDNGKSDTHVRTMPIFGYHTIHTTVYYVPRTGDLCKRWRSDFRFFLHCTIHVV